MEGYRGKPRRDDVRRKVWEVQARSRRKLPGMSIKIERRERLALRNKVKSEKRFEIYVGLRWIERRI